MKCVIILLSWCAILVSSCKKHNHVYSVSSLDHAYEYDPTWDYKGYKSNEDIHLYRTYQPDPNNGLAKKTLDKLDEEKF